MDYDVLVLGGGILGCAIAYELSKYNLNISVIEKDYDICNDMPSINSSVVFDGIEAGDEMTSKLMRKGSLLMRSYADRFKVPYLNVGTVYVAHNDEEVSKINEICKRADEKGIKEVKRIATGDINKYESNLSQEVCDGLYISDTAVISAYDLALAYGEIAFDNGVNFKFEEQVESIHSTSKGFNIKTSRNKFTSKIVIDVTNDKSLIRNDRKLNLYKEKYLKYMIINKPYDTVHNNMMLNINKNRTVCIRPSIDNNIVCAYITDKNISYNRVIEEVKEYIGEVKNNDIKMVRNWRVSESPVSIDDDLYESGYMNILMDHFGKVTITPSLALNVAGRVVEKLNCKLKKDFNDKRREYFKFKDMSEEEINNIIKLDSKYGNIVCQCEKVTEGEIVEAIRRPLGARTLTGVRRRTGAGYGSCDGCYCRQKIVDILARETNKRITEVVNNSKDSTILSSRIKEFNDM